MENSVFGTSQKGQKGIYYTHHAYKSPSLMHGIKEGSMEMTLQERLDKLLDAYSHNYDIYRDVTVEGGSFPAAAF